MLEEGQNEEEKEENTDLLTPINDSVIAETASEKPQEPIQRNSTESTTERSNRRRITLNTSNAFRTTAVPVMSQNRRNSYLSITERRKYYNRTQVQSKKPESFESVRLESTTKPPQPSTSTEAFQANEIHISEVPVPKEVTRGVVVDKKNLLGVRNAVKDGSFQDNEKQIKAQSTRQLVIQSQFEFGQKLNSRKPIPRPLDISFLDDRTKKKKARTETVEISTIKVDNQETQSTKLVIVNETIWSTTLSPQNRSEVENLVVHPSLNRTLQEYNSENETKEVVAEISNSENITTTTHIYGENVETNKEKLNDSLPAGVRMIPLPLSFENTTEKVIKNETETKKEVTKQVPNDQPLANTQDLLRLNSNRKSIIRTLRVHELFDKNSKRNLTRPVFNNPKTTNTNPTIGRNGSEIPKTKAVTPPPFFRNGKYPYYGLDSKGGVRSSRPFFNFKSYNRTTTLPSKPDATLQGNNKSRGNSSSTGWSNTEKYPQTIELNENNKRLLSEMFETTQSTKPGRVTTR